MLENELKNCMLQSQEAHGKPRDWLKSIFTSDQKGLQ